MTGAALAPRPVCRAAVDEFIARYGPDPIDRWVAAGEIVIVEKEGVQHERNSSKNR